MAKARTTNKSRSKSKTATKAKGRATSVRKTSAGKASKRKPRSVKALHNAHFANESSAYRRARNALLIAERDLRRQVERVAAMRRKLPLGGVVPEDYVFAEGGRDLGDMQSVVQVRLSELFGGKDTLIAYSYMYGPKMEKPCPMCTAILDGLNGNAEHIAQRANLVVIAKSPIGRIREFARSRRWSKLRLLSSANNAYNRDYRGEANDGSQWPSLNVFVRRNGKTHHFWHSELLLAPADAGQNNRHVDMIWPLWNMLDLTPEGRGTDWFPKLNYGN